MRVAILVVIVLAGCADATEPVANVDAVDDAAADGPATRTVERLVNATVPVAWDGITKEGVWVCNTQQGTGGCPAGQQIQPDGRHATTIAYTANLTRIQLNVTWTPADATQTGLVVAAYANTTGSTLIAVASGASPLTIDVETPGVVPDGAVSLIAWPQGKTPTSPSLFIDATRQPFTVEGALHTQDTQRVEVPVETN